jgi:hypothetical protein
VVWSRFPDINVLREKGRFTGGVCQKMSISPDRVFGENDTNLMIFHDFSDFHDFCHTFVKFLTKCIKIFNILLKKILKILTRQTSHFAFSSASSSSGFLFQI